MRPCLSTVAIAIGVFWKKRMKRTSAARCGSLPPSRARLSTSVREAPGAPSAPKATLWNSRAGTVRPPRVLRSMSRISVFTSPGTAASVVISAAPSPGHDVLELEAAGADLGEIVVEPVGERGVEIGDVAVALGREEAGRRMVEIVDRVLQLLEDVLVPLELARDVGQRPDRHALVLLAFAERAHADAQPAAGLALVGADPHLLLAAAALARRLEQAIDRLRHPGIADEHALDRPHVVGVGRLDQAHVGGVGIEHAPARVGDHDAFVGVVDHRLEQRARGLLARDAQDAGGEREQQEHADHGERREQREDIGLGMGAADEQQPRRRPHERERDEQHEANAAAAAPARPGAVARQTGMVVDQVLLRHDRRGIALFALPLECPSP